MIIRTQTAYLNAWLGLSAPRREAMLAQIAASRGSCRYPWGSFHFISLKGSSRSAGGSMLVVHHDVSHFASRPSHLPGTCIRLRPLPVPLQGNQEATAPPEAMAQPYPPAQFPPPPQNGIPPEYAAPHPHPAQDYTGQSTVPDHAMTIYTPTQTHSEPPGTDSSTPSLTGTTTVPVSSAPYK